MGDIKTGSCHCGKVQFEIDLDQGFLALNRCDCSLCRRRGTVMGGIPLDKFKLIAGADNLAVYQWHTNTAKHYFCQTCSVYTHHQRRSDPTQYGVNIGCVDGINPFSPANIPVTHGASEAHFDP